MKKSIKKFYDFLNSYVIDNADPKLLDLIENKKVPCGRPISVVHNSKRMILYFDKMNEEDKIKSREYKKIIDEIDFLKNVLKGGKIDIFNEYELLSKYLVKSKLDCQECFDVINSLIKMSLKDLEKYNLDNIREFKNLHIVSFTKLNEISEEEKNEVLEYIHYLNIPQNDLKDDGLRKKEYVLTFISKLTIPNPLEFVNQIYRYKRSYLGKKDSFTDFDINDIISSLLVLGIDKNICSNISILLKEKIEKRKEKAINKSSCENEKSYRYRYDTDNNVLKKELRRYYDFYNKEKSRELTIEEIKETLYLLIKLDFSEEDIQKFLNYYKLDYKKYVSKNISMINNTNCRLLYLKLYDKLKFYEGRLNISSNLKYIEDCFMEMFLSDDVDYYFYKTEIENELLRILNLLPQTFEYELLEVDKRIKLEK